VLAIDKAALETRGVDYQLVGRLAMPGGVEPTGAVRPTRHVNLRITIPPVPCQTMLQSIPAQLIPKMVGFQMKGNFGTDVLVDIDWANLEATKLQGSVGIRGCKVVKAPKEMDPKRLEGSFEHEIEVAPDKWDTIKIGPDSQNFVAIEEVSPHLLNSLMTTEDSSFYRHRGFITKEFRTALVKNLKAGYFKYGASSITMQLVKNVLLHREKTLSRKFQELFLTWYIETKLEKDRLFEIYVNAIEYGPGLYGIKPAAYQYFGKPPSELNPREAAFFSSILPAPKRRYKQFCQDKLSGWTLNKIDRILQLMLKRERLSEEDYQTALATPLVFQPDKRGFCDRKYAKWGIK
jgi:membrane peptidoglycan carboxypeptidase